MFQQGDCHMNTTILNKKLHGLVATILLGGLSALAQMSGTGAPAGVSGGMLKLLGNFSAFEAKGRIEVLDGKSLELQSATPIDFALLEKKMRIEMDLARMTGKATPAFVLTTLEKLGMSRVVSLIRPDKKAIYIIYPGQKVVCRLALPKEEAEAAGKESKVEKTVLGKETLDGHPCVKNRVVLTDETGNSIEATTWNATDLKEFPIKIETKEKDKIQLMRFQKVEFIRPDAKQFEPPADYQQFTELDALMQSVLEKQTSGGASK
jgi:hypothetical protein